MSHYTIIAIAIYLIRFSVSLVEVCHRFTKNKKETYAKHSFIVTKHSVKMINVSLDFTRGSKKEQSTHKSLFLSSVRFNTFFPEREKEMEKEKRERERDKETKEIFSSNRLTPY